MTVFLTRRSPRVSVKSGYWARIGGKRGHVVEALDLIKHGYLSCCVTANIAIGMIIETLTIMHRLYRFQIQLQAMMISI